MSVAGVNGRLALVALVALLADQASKWLILLVVMQPPRVIEVTGFFNLVLVFNRGVSFGLFASGGQTGAYLLAGLSLAIVVGVLVWVRGQDRRLIDIAGGLIIGGALGNVVDRLVHRAVVDFLDVYWGRWHWPAFNLADTAIVVGVGLVLFDALFTAQSRSK